MTQSILYFTRIAGINLKKIIEFDSIQMNKVYLSAPLSATELWKSYWGFKRIIIAAHDIAKKRLLIARTSSN